MLTVSDIYDLMLYRLNKLDEQLKEASHRALYDEGSKGQRACQEVEVIKARISCYGSIAQLIVSEDEEDFMDEMDRIETGKGIH